MSFLVEKMVNDSGVTYSLKGAGYAVLIILCVAFTDNWLCCERLQ